MALTTFDKSNVTTTKQFSKACQSVFGGIKARNEQVQQLLILAVNEAARESSGQVTNNLTWLTELIKYAEGTQGINFTKVVRYVKEVLCCNTVAWSATKNQLQKTSKKDVVLTYNTEPESSWYDYGKANNAAKEFDYGKRVTSAINSAMKADKGGMSAAEVVAAILASDSINLDDLLNAVGTETTTKVKEVSKVVDDNPAFDIQAA